MVLIQTVTLNVAINSHSKALLTILVSNNFVELKGSVFKKFETNNLFQMSCSGECRWKHAYSDNGLLSTTSLVPSYSSRRRRPLFTALVLLAYCTLLSKWALERYLNCTFFLLMCGNVMYYMYLPKINCHSLSGHTSYYNY